MTTFANLLILSVIVLAEGLLSHEQMLTQLICPDRPHCTGGPSSKVSTHAGLCRAAQKQCMESACRSICLSDLFSMNVNVNCSKAPGWTSCGLFEQEIRQAERNLIAQLKARVCERLGACQAPPNGEYLMHWIQEYSEDAFLASRKSSIPLETCSNLQNGSSMAFRMCHACEQIVSVDIDIHGDCHAMLQDVVQKRSGLYLMEIPRDTSEIVRRCQVTRNVLITLKTTLEDHLNTKVCSCLGCCGDSTCFFHSEDNNLFLE